MASNPKTLNEMREVLGRFLQESPDASKLWDLLTCLRGPDSPSERPSMTGEQQGVAYAARRARKAKTVEVIRHHAFNGVVGGSARHRGDINYVTLPPKEEWEHFDRHVLKAAQVLGLEVRIEESAPGLKATREKPAEEPTQKGMKKFGHLSYVNYSAALQKLMVPESSKIKYTPLPLLED